MIPEAQLCELVRQLDEQALVEAYDRYSAELYRYALRLLGDEDLAEDCVAETYSRFLTAIKNGGGPERFLRAYLYRTAHNWVTDTYRRKPPDFVQLDAERKADDIASDPPEAVAEELERQSLRRALARLTPEQRQVIALKYLEDWDHQDIAEALHKPVGAVKALQHRAVASLRRLMIQEDEGSNVLEA